MKMMFGRFGFAPIAAVAGAVKRVATRSATRMRVNMEYLVEFVWAIFPVIVRQRSARHELLHPLAVDLGDVDGAARIDTDAVRQVTDRRRFPSRPIAAAIS